MKKIDFRVFVLILLTFMIAACNIAAAGIKTKLLGWTMTVIPFTTLVNVGDVLMVSTVLLVVFLGLFLGGYGSAGYLSIGLHV